MLELIVRTSVIVKKSNETKIFLVLYFNINYDLKIIGMLYII